MSDADGDRPARRAAARQIRESAPAKLNLYLHVLGRRNDGYHLLDSLIAFADAHDVVTAEEAEELSLAVTGPFAGPLKAEDDNLVLRAARALAAAGGRFPDARLTLDKRLPVAAGIGGGSADAAAALRALSALWDLRPPPEDLAALALGLGADVPVCLAGHAAFVGGIGEALTPAPALPPAALVLVNPGRPTPTPKVFARLGGVRSLPARFERPPADAANLASVLCERRNDLTAAATALVPEIAAALAAIDGTPDCLLARMTGSGATCFGLYGAAGEAERAAAAVAAVYPAWWVVSAKLVSDCREVAVAAPG